MLTMSIAICILIYALSFFAARWTCLETMKEEVLFDDDIDHFIVACWFAPVLNTALALANGIPILIDMADKNRKFRGWLYRENHTNHEHHDKGCEKN